MNDELNQNENTTSNYNNDTTYCTDSYRDSQNQESTYQSSAGRSVSSSEPYRYKFESGEKSENIYHTNEQRANENPYSSFAGYNDYYSSNAYTYGNAENYNTYNSYPTPKKKRPFAKFLKFVASAACFGLIAGGTFCGVTYLVDHMVTENQDTISQTGTTGIPTNGNTSMSTTGLTTITIAPTESNDVEAVEEDGVVVKVVEENMAAAVAIQCTYVTTYSYFGQRYQKETVGGGSGIIVGMNDTELLIATNNHVVNGATKIESVFIDDTILEASVKGTDSIADLAIVAVPLSSFTEETLSKIHIATLGDSDRVKVGEMAIAIGNALGYGQSVTVGYISAKDRTVNVDGNEMVLLQTDAAINQGNSGGALFNTKGEVIGINSVKYSDTSVEGMCFAIPISRAIPILNELMNRETLAEEEQGYLGVEIKTVTDEIASFYGWPVGIYVARVVEGGAAEKAGIYAGDIITAVNGVQVVTDVQLKSAVTSYRYGTTVDVVVQRNTNGEFKEVTLSVTLMKNPNLAE